MHRTLSIVVNALAGIVVGLSLFNAIAGCGGHTNELDAGIEAGEDAAAVDAPADEDVCFPAKQACPLADAGDQ